MPPFGQSRGKSGREPLEGRLDRTTQRRTGITHLGQLGCEADVDADTHAIIAAVLGAGLDDNLDLETAGIGDERGLGAIALVHEGRRGHQALAVMERHLADHRWFTGDDYGIADIALFAYTDVAGDGGFDLARYPALRDWLARVRATPRFVAMAPPSAEAAALLARAD